MDQRDQGGQKFARRIDFVSKIKLPPGSNTISSEDSAWAVPGAEGRKEISEEERVLPKQNTTKETKEPIRFTAMAD